ncbi:MAG: FAD-dependent oxidoreductase [Candidatus Nitrosopolaris sp.]
MISRDQYDVAIIGGGILGISIAYFLSSIAHPSKRILLIEQEHDVAFHTSARNTGKVHAPFLYDPIRQTLFARAAFIGFNMLKEYCILKSLPFKQDGVLQVATHDKGIDRLHKYLEWGYSNGLQKNELKFLDKREVFYLEPHVKCLSAIYCLKDGSVDYEVISKVLMEDAKKFGCKTITDTKLVKVLYDTKNDHVGLITNNGQFITKYLVNTAGGGAIDIAHRIGLATEYTDLHFRGEYWQAPEEFHDLAKMSIYSVPKYPEYPFLDPHWIVRVDGRREIGPNAVPVFSPYAYNWNTNLRFFIPKLIESYSRKGVRKILLDSRFLSLASVELKGSLSKTVMINRVREFLPEIRASSFSKRGTAGIRSILVGSDGKFVGDTMIIKNDYSLNVLNYNSPGATGSLPLAALITHELITDGILTSPSSAFRKKSIWDTTTIANQMRHTNGVGIS